MLKELFYLTAIVSFAVCGAWVRYQYVLSQDRKTKKEFSMRMVTAVFMGCLHYCVQYNWQMHITVACPIAGMLGYSGPDGLDWIRRLMIYAITGAIGKKFNENKLVLPKEEEDDELRESE